MISLGLEVFSFNWWFPFQPGLLLQLINHLLPTGLWHFLEKQQPDTSKSPKEKGPPYIPSD